MSLIVVSGGIEKSIIELSLALFPVRRFNAAAAAVELRHHGNVLKRSGAVA